MVRMTKSTVSRLEGQNVRWYTDNKNVVRILKAGSGVPGLQEKAMTIQNICEKKNVKTDPVWLPRNKNKRADKLSRLADRDDCHVRWKEFFHLDRKWFASHYNTSIISKKLLHVQ